MAKKIRSPSYPAIGLREAVELCAKLYPSGRHALGADVIASMWRYKGLASASLQLAACKKYGLLTKITGKADRMLRLTDLALDIVTDPHGDSPERNRAIKRAAISPKIHEEMWEKWGENLPPDREIQRYLERERHFNPNHVATVIQVFKDTVDFAGLKSDDISVEPKWTVVDQGPEMKPTVETAASDVGRATVCLPGLMEDVYPTQSGNFVLRWPEFATSAEVDEFEEWIKLVTRKIRRVSSSSSGA